MKKVIPFVLAALLMVLAISCQKEPVPPAPQELKPTLEVFKIPDGEVPYGSKITIFWKTKNVKSLKFNGILQPQSAIDSGSITFERVCSDALYTIKATNISLSTEKEIEVHVGDWTTSKFGLVSYYPWKKKEYRILRLDGTLDHKFDPDPREMTEVFYYHKDGKKTYKENSGIDEWEVANEKLRLNKEYFNFKVSDVELSIFQETTYAGEPAIFESVYEHASTTPTDK
ncbi:MAG: hypothetical protein EOM85_02340 [Candidatus Moranbacteria bacterium]|nr:hypothetical protein [Candidatus Moranbacteria bacterium]